MDDASVTSSQVSSRVSSRAHSPCFSESMDESFTPGNSPAGTLKDQFRRRYSKYELQTDNFQYLFDKDILDACKVCMTIVIHSSCHSQLVSFVTQVMILMDDPITVF